MKRIRGHRFAFSELGVDDRCLQIKGDDGKYYFAKSTASPKEQGLVNPTWVANELIYHCVAEVNHLPQPEACLVEYEGSLHFGSEYIPGRDAIRGPETEGNKRLIEIVSANPAEAGVICRALLLDLALLNSDRKPWNILIDANSVPTKLCFFDHDKALLGDGLSDRWRVSEKYDPVTKWSDYIECSGANHVVASRLSDEEILSVFDSLTLDPSIFPAVRSECPSEWLHTGPMEELLSFLERWWRSLQAEFHKNPRCFRAILDQKSARQQC